MALLQAADLRAIAANLHAVEARIRAACARCGRDPSEVTLIGVTKRVPAARVRSAIDACLADVGENYVQEGLAKRVALGEAGAPVRWHLIGHLQSNKVGAALEGFDIIHAVDSVRLAEALSRRASRLTPVLLEVNSTREASKFGLDPRDVAPAVATISKLENLELRGLTTVAPATTDEGRLRAVFSEVRLLAEAEGLIELSMGMTDDFEVAIEEGATMVRIGRAIFGERTP